MTTLDSITVSVVQHRLVGIVDEMGEAMLRTSFSQILNSSRDFSTAITDATIWTAVEECQAESATFDCPASQATYGPIEDWDVGAVTSLNTWGNGCTESAEWKCGRASLSHFA